MKHYKALTLRLGLRLWLELGRYFNLGFLYETSSISHAQSSTEAP